MTCLTVSAGVRRAPISIVSGLCIAHLMSVSICGGIGGGKKRGVTLARAFFDDAAHVGQKSHVEHPVGFVEHEKFDLVEPQRALFQMVEQASGRGDDDVRAGAQFVVLPAVTDAAVERRWFSDW